jgi:hypothetical protein
MRDITELMNTYRECSRNLWNVYYSQRETMGCYLDTYEQIRKLLFDSLVADELLYEETADSANIPPPVLRVVPIHKPQILIKSPNAPGENSYWGVAKDLYVSSDDITLEFIDYFDFSNVRRRDFQYYRCKILHFPAHTEFQGRDALMQVLDGRVFHDDSQ